MFKLPMSDSRRQFDMYASKEVVVELRDKSIALFDKYQETQKEIEEFRLINKELTGLVFRLANNIYSLQTQLDDVKKDFETNSHRVIAQVVAEIRADLDGYLDGQSSSDTTQENAS